MTGDNTPTKSESSPKAASPPAKSESSPKAASPPADGAAKPEAVKPDAVKPEGGASTSYSRGEGQKPVSQAYKDNWNAIYGKKAKTTRTKAAKPKVAKAKATKDAKRETTRKTVAKAKKKSRR